MSNYPSWWDSTLTIYNRHIDSETHIVTWFKHIVPNCFWKSTGGTVQVGGTILDTSSIVCRIPKQENFCSIEVWSQLSDSDMNTYFTLQQGDIIIKGTCDDVIDEYSKGSRSTDILTKYKSLGRCVEIREFAINTMKGILTPHYYVRGL